MKIIGVHGRLTKDGAKDIDLLIHPQHDDGTISPYVVWTDYVSETHGGSVASLDQAFDAEAATHTGYKVQEREPLVQIKNPKAGNVSRKPKKRKP